jgi:hypothetical protein
MKNPRVWGSGTRAQELTDRSRPHPCLGLDAVGRVGVRMHITIRHGNHLLGVKPSERNWC